MAGLPLFAGLIRPQSSVPPSHRPTVPQSPHPTVPLSSSGPLGANRLAGRERLQWRFAIAKSLRGGCRRNDSWSRRDRDCRNNRRGKHSGEG